MSKLNAKLIENQLEYNRRCVASGSKLTSFQCQHCMEFSSTVQPKKSDVGSKGFWDSARQCIFCGKLNFVCVYPSGKTSVTKMNVNF